MRIICISYGCFFSSHAHFLPVASIHDIVRLDSQTIFHMCTDTTIEATNTITQAHTHKIAPLHTHCLTFSMLYFIFVRFFTRQSQRIVCNDYENLCELSVLRLYTCTQYDSDLKCGAAVCIFFLYSFLWAFFFISCVVVVAADFLLLHSLWRMLRFALKPRLL